MALCWCNQPLPWQKTDWTSSYQTFPIQFASVRRHVVAVYEWKSPGLLTEPVEWSLHNSINWHLIISGFTSALGSSLSHFLGVHLILLVYYWRFEPTLSISFGWNQDTCQLEGWGIMGSIPFLLSSRYFPLKSCWSDGAALSSPLGLRLGKLIYWGC